jgi:hypothetical protein
VRNPKLVQLHEQPIKWVSKISYISAHSTAAFQKSVNIDYCRGSCSRRADPLIGMTEPSALRPGSRLLRLGSHVRMPGPTGATGHLRRQSGYPGGQRVGDVRLRWLLHYENTRAAPLLPFGSDQRFRLPLPQRC